MKLLTIKEKIGVAIGLSFEIGLVVFALINYLNY